MVKLTLLDEKIVPLVHEGLTEEQLSEAFSYRRIFKTIISLSIAKSGEEAIDLMQLGMKLKLAETDIEIEDGEFKLLRKLIDENKSQLLNGLLQGSSLIYLDKCQKESKDKNA